LPSITGLQLLASHQAAERAAKKHDIERKEVVRLKIYPIIIAILGLIISYLGYKLWMTK
jgi:hypothetical protein